MVFMDSDDIDAGGDFRAIIVRAVAGCDVMVLVIGTGWLMEQDVEGRRKLDLPEDLVRIEVETALTHHVSILPVLVEGASMPLAKSLPESVASVSSINAFDLSPKHFGRDIATLTQKIRDELDAAEQRRLAPDRIEERLRLIRERRVELDREETALHQQLQLRILKDEGAFQAELAAGAPRIDQRGEPRRPYGAFLLYSHVDDARVAAALQRQIEEFGRAAGTKVRLFRDVTNLAATPDLWNSIAPALDRSENLVLLASPASARSMWVHRALEYWFERGRATDRVLIVLCEGEIVWDNESNDFDWSRTTALPDLLRGRFAEEPLYFDLRLWKDIEDTSHPVFQDFVATLAAVILGYDKSELVASVYQRRTKLRTMLTSVVLLLLLMLMALALVVLTRQS
jgi:hypothetical protein